MGEDVTETLEVIPKSWKVIQHVREKFTCRDACSIPKCRKRFKRARDIPRTDQLTGLVLIWV